MHQRTFMSKVLLDFFIWITLQLCFCTGLLLHSHMLHTLCLCFCAFLCVHAHPWLCLWQLMHLSAAFPQANYGHSLPRHIKYPAAASPLLRACKLRCMLAFVCVCTRASPRRQAALTGSHDSQVRERYSRVFLSLSFSLPSPFGLSIFFLSISAAEGFIEQTWHSIFCCTCWLAGDSCVYFWSTACLMQLSVCTAC